MTRIKAFGTVAAALLLAGCGTTVVSAPAPDFTSTTTPPPATPLPGDTPAGTRLHFGQEGVITLGLASAPLQLGVIITGVDKSTPADMNVLKSAFGSQITNWAYLVRLTLINVNGATDTSGFSGPTLDGGFDDGGDAGSLMLMGEDLVLPSCTDYNSPPSNWTERGARFDSCQVMFADPDQISIDLGKGATISWQ